MAEKHIVKNWRGRRASYNFLKEQGALSTWTRYVVIEDDGNGTITEYYGENQVSIPSGQLLPVKDIVSEEPTDASPYDRYLVGTDEEGYSVVEYTPIINGREGELVKSTIPFDEKYGVRVVSHGLKNFIYFDGKLRTYDDVDCGLF